MARKSAPQHLTDDIAGQHLALPVAAHLARTQLVPDPQKVHDAQQVGDVLNAVAAALARTAPLYVADAAGGELRQLTPGELEGCAARHSASTLVLKDGRTLAGVSMRRADLRQAILILKALGLEGVAPPPAAPAQPKAPDDVARIRVRLEQIEELLKPPLLPAQVERAKAATVWIARHAPHGRVANLAMQLMSALHETRGLDETPGGFRMALARLGAALENSGTEP